MDNRKGFLSKSDFLKASSLTQILSCDIIVEDGKRRFLVGLRKNSPAKNTLFVPGGRLFKGECLSNGIKRVMKKELGTDFKYNFIGIYEHLYENDNCSGAKNIDSHYVVMAIHVKLDEECIDMEQFSIQHDSGEWMSRSELLENDKVHNYTKSYFVKNPINRFIGPP